ncbi:MAG: leucyl aminopeptidase, partial [Ktedonobacteraceae bacterium]|nr:leucyl aminopeptidase [Ktedonobacteraceae bacterium]
VVGLGKDENVTTQSLRRASAVAARHLQNSAAQQITLALQANTIDAAQAAQAQTEGALLGLYSFRSYQSKGNDNQGKAINTLNILATTSDQQTVAQAIHTGQALAEATNFARDLVNEPPSVLTPVEMASRASAMAQRFGLECEIFEKDKIVELGMGGLLAVSQGSELPPRFIVLRYRAANASKQLALVGKGITFDSGGLSLKPAAGMESMKGDMGGAAAVLGAMQAIGALKPNINVTGIVPTCENMPSGTAYHPGDIVRISNGKTIEIVNTDAEGRLILADALSYAVKNGISPIIDLATLTGAIVVSLGHVHTGLFSNDESLRDDIIAAGRAAGEKYWPMPLDEEYGDLIKSDIADIKQTGGRAGGSITAAKILEQFVGDSAWAHLDIAGTSSGEKKPYQEPGGTGVGVRTLYQLAHNMGQ